MDQLTGLRVACLVADLKSFSAAGARLGLSPAMTSKHVMALERRLGVRLFNRTSRHVSLTEAGNLFVDQARHALESLDEAEANLSQASSAPQGVLRMSAPVWMANPHFAALIGAYRARYPGVKLEVELSGRFVNLVEEGFDLALRATFHPSPGLIARRLGDLAFLLVASPTFLDGAGRPRQPADLKGAALLAYHPLLADGVVKLDSAEGTESVTLDPVLQSANETLLHEAALAGLGVAILPRFLVERDIAEGRLERLLEGWTTLPRPLFAVYPSRRYLTAKVRTFLDALVEAKLFS
jgi:DNA-binding transcriptional LysR family regulator